MFKNLQETIKALNADVKDVANCEKAKNLRKKLIKIGLPLSIIGWLGVFVCFVLFATAGNAAFGPNGFSARLIVPMVLFLPLFIMGGIGSTIAGHGFNIVVTGYATNLIDEVVGNNCPNCGESINSEMCFCTKCGTAVRKECPNCKHVNDVKNEYCAKCGTKLN